MNPLLLEDEVNANPIEQLKLWWSEARNAGCAQASAMAVATVEASGMPAMRALILRGIDEDGLTFFSRGESPKAHQIAADPSVGVLFTWHELAREVRLTGRAERADRSAAAAQFGAKTRARQIADASFAAQSAPIEDRQTLETAYKQAETDLASQPIPCPADYTTFRIRPESFEFWQGHDDNGLHDRLLYTRHGAAWRLVRLTP